METYSVNPILHQHPATGTERWLSSAPRLLVYPPYAAKKQLEIIGWQRDDYPKNRREQGGWLIGRYILDAAGNPVQGEVTEVLEAMTTYRYLGYIKWDAMEEIRLQRVFFQLQDELAKTDPAAAERLTVLGWWHTHPNSLDVFLSETDRETIRLKYYKPEKYSVVLNPHRGIFKAFAGAQAEEVPMILLLDDDKAQIPTDVRREQPPKQDPGEQKKPRSKRKNKPKHKKKHKNKKRR